MYVCIYMYVCMNIFMYVCINMYDIHTYIHTYFKNALICFCQSSINIEHIKLISHNVHSIYRYTYCYFYVACRRTDGNHDAGRRPSVPLGKYIHEVIEVYRPILYVNNVCYFIYKNSCRKTTSISSTIKTPSGTNPRSQIFVHKSGV